MADQLQAVDFKQSHYERPNQKWHCGRLQEGRACQSGPDSKGKCRGQNDAEGGDGPRPACQPRLNLLHRKKRLSRWLTALVITTLLVLYQLDGGKSLFKPGNLSPAHADLLDCNSCHSGADLDFVTKIKHAVKLHGFDDSKQCLACHGLGEAPLSPHNQANLEAATPSQEKTQKGSLLLRLSSQFSAAGRPQATDSGQADEAIYCSNCHREHRGDGKDLVAMSNQRCQSCHQNQFKSLADGHPEFEMFPYKRSTRIKFDHGSHINKHFSDPDYSAAAPLGCKQCHQPDATGNWMLSKHFDEACSSCHLEQIKGLGRATDNGVAMLSIPELDVESLELAGFHVGEWPSEGASDLSPMMQLMLESNPRYEAITSVLGSIELFDLSTTNYCQRKMATELVWIIKGLLYDISVGGVVELQSRLQSALEEEIDYDELGGVFSALPEAVVVNTFQRWLPSLASEVEAYRNGEISLIDQDALPMSEMQEFEAIKKQLQAESENLLSENSTRAQASNLEDEGILVSDDILATAGLDEINLEAESLELDLGLDLDSEMDLDQLDLQEQQADVEDESEVDAELESQNPWMTNGGWYQDDSVIRYRPAVHADPFLEHWLSLTARVDNAVSRRVFKSLSEKNAVGTCVKCHSVEALDSVALESVGEPDKTTPGPAARINWRSFLPDASTTGFSRYSHTTHFSLMDDKGCGTCHRVNQEEGYMASYDDTDPDHYQSSFDSISREICATCHRQDRAPDSCLTCHNYHVGKIFSPIDSIRDDFTESTGGLIRANQ